MHHGTPNKYRGRQKDPIKPHEYVFADEAGDDYGDEEVYEDDDMYEEDELTEEELDEQAKRCLKCFNFFLMLVGLGVVALAYYTGSLAYGGAWFVYVVAALGLGVFIISFIGCLGVAASSARILVLYYSVMIFLSMGTMLMGGLTFIYTKSALNHLEENWDSIRQDLSDEEKQSLTLEEAQDELQMFIRLTGGACFILFLLLLTAMGNVTRLLTKVKAYTLAIQATCITLVPMGMLLIAGGIFLADTAATVEAPVTSFAFFILGMFVLIIAVLGYGAASIAARGPLKLFMRIVALVCLLFLAFGIATFVQAERVKAAIIDNWESIRRVLPPTFSGKFDRDQFSDFVEANLIAMGFLAMCIAVLLGSQWYCAIGLRSALKEERVLAMEREAEVERLKEELGYVDDGDEFFADAEATSAAQRFWFRRWKHGTKKSRRLIMCGCCICCCCVFLILAVASLTLFFSIACTTISDSGETFLYDSSVEPNVHAVNHYGRGTSSMALDDSAVTTLEFTKQAFRKSYLKPGWPVMTTTASDYGDVSEVTATMADRVLVLGFDISCQKADFKVLVPKAGGANSVADSASGAYYKFTTESDLAGVEIDFSGETPPDIPRFKRIDMSTTNGPQDLDSIKVGWNGLSSSSDLGEIVVKNMDAQCNADFLGTEEAGVTLSTKQGFVSLESSTVVDCEVNLSGEQSLVELKSTTVSATLGDATVHLVNNEGAINLESSTTDVFDIKSQVGSVRASDLNIGLNFLAASTGGRVVLDTLKVKERGSVQVETESGAVQITLSEFAGLVSVYTSGSIQCQGTGFDTSASGTKCAVRTLPSGIKEATGSINCLSQNDCSYLGEVLVISNLGSVTITGLEWTRP